ncbi:MAG: AraC family transcriptional regulator [Lentisphaeria bacterium]|nr:AraC family transcriptional regulator [Lentisphaeria bacterium]
MDFQKWISRLGSEIILLEINYFQASEKDGTIVHAHPGQLHIACFEKGSGICTLNGIKHRIRSGDICLILPGEMHQFNPDPENPYRACFLHFSWFGSLPAELPAKIKVSRDRRSTFFKLCRELADSSKEYRHTPGGEFFLYAGLLTFWGYLLRFAAASNNSIPNTLRPATGINKLINPVIEKLHGPPFFYPGIDELAESCGISRRKLTKLFKSCAGCSIKQYYLANIMRYAKKMRQTKSMSTAELARKCGYSSAQNFLLAYKKYFDRHSGENAAGDILIWRGNNPIN